MTQFKNERMKSQIGQYKSRQRSSPHASHLRNKFPLIRIATQSPRKDAAKSLCLGPGNLVGDTSRRIKRPPFPKRRRVAVNESSSRHIMNRQNSRFVLERTIVVDARASPACGRLVDALVLGSIHACPAVPVKRDTDVDFARWNALGEVVGDTGVNVEVACPAGKGRVGIGVVGGVEIGRPLRTPRSLKVKVTRSVRTTRACMGSALPITNLHIVRHIIDPVDVIRVSSRLRLVHLTNRRSGSNG